MQLVSRKLCVLALAWPLAAQGGDVKISVRIEGWPLLAVLRIFEPRYTPQPSPQHIGVGPARAADACTFVAGVRHCPLPKLPRD